MTLYPTRRDLLFSAGNGFGALALGDMLTAESRAAQQGSQNPLAPLPPHLPGTAKSVIFLFMQGGPSHLETFDNKPMLRKHDGQLLPDSLRDFDLAQINTADAKVMAPQFSFAKYGQNGQEISSLFPHLSQHADRLTIIKSMHHELFIHGSAMIMMHSGTSLLGHPSIGAWVTYGLGCESDNLPSYIAMTDSIFRNGASMYTSGFLPAVYQGTTMRAEGVPIQNLQRHADLTGREQRILLDQISSWNRRYRETRPGDSRLDARISNYELAYRMQTAAPELIDLSSETQETRQLYGVEDGPSARFGKMCLMSRRMVERGVRYVQLISGGWDAHGDCKGNHAAQAKKIDQPIAGLITDLAQRGLLDSTLLVWVGEFGRTPICQGSNGRDHHPYGFSAWLAGGGTVGGRSIGATDDFGFNAVEDRIHVNDLHATMLGLLGIDHEDLSYYFEGRDHRLTDVGGLNNLAHRLVRG
ncbi:MAG TPA: DUF1501 domain-containing protein [Planctomycetes bacterium]|nr:DUF1501 domain-containing protein [Fuerstiella sp.]HIK94171.1 DUF1501 domain-containing protein [Planctomycetota bacterium]